MGWEQADGVVALLVAVVIFRTAIGVIRGVGRTLGDAARLPAPEIAAAAREVAGVRDCHSVRTRGLESQVFVDLHVVVAPGTTVEESHAIAHAVEDALRGRFTQIVDVVVHIEPDAASLSRAEAGSRPADVLQSGVAGAGIGSGPSFGSASRRNARLNPRACQPRLRIEP